MKKIILSLLLVLTIVFYCACGSETSGIAEEENLPELVTVMDEYYYVDSIGQAEHVLIVKNNSSKTVSVDSNVIVKDASGKTIAASTGTTDAIASGTEACIETFLRGVEEESDFEYTLTIEEDTLHEPVVQDLSFEQSLNGDKVIVTCTNNGGEAAKHLKIAALFFRDGKFVYYGVSWLPEIQGGATTSVEVYARESYEKEMAYDEAKVYISGWR